MNNHDKYNDCKTQLEQIYKIKANEMKIRSKYEEYKHGEKSSKFSLIFKADFNQLFVMTKKAIMREKLILTFILYSIVYIDKNYHFLLLIGKLI